MAIAGVLEVDQAHAIGGDVIVRGSGVPVGECEVRVRFRVHRDDARVGGDWYDAVALDDELVVFSIGDVCGHGLDAAVTMGRVRQAIVGVALDTKDAGTVLAKVNRLLALQQAPMITAVVGFIDLHANRLNIASAGHPASIIISDGKVQLLQTGDIPLAVDGTASYATRTFSLEKETFVTLYTDGLIEARRDLAADQQRVISAAKQAAHGSMSACDIRDYVLGTTASSDDVSVLTVRIEAPLTALVAHNR